MYFFHKRQKNGNPLPSNADTIADGTAAGNEGSLKKSESLNPNGLRSSSDFRVRPTTTATSFIHTTTTAFVSANPAAADNNPTTRDGLFRKRLRHRDRRRAPLPR